MKCAVSGCTTGYKKLAAECSLFSFPTDPNVARKWKLFCRQGKCYNFKNCYICMDHFVGKDFENSLQYEMGFAKKRMLRRGVVPSIYKPGEKNPERSERVQRRENKKIVGELLNNASTSCEDAAQFVYEMVNEDVEKNTRIPEAVPEGIMENCSLQYDGDLHAHASFESNLNETSVMLRRSLAEEFEDFQNNIEALQQENGSLRKENHKLLTEITALKRGYECERKKKSYEMEELQKRFLRAEFAWKNMEEKLEGIFTKGQIAKLKNGVKKPSWSEDDISQSIALYAAGPKSYKLMYKKGFPLPGVRTLQTWSRKISLSVEESSGIHDQT